MSAGYLHLSLSTEMTQSMNKSSEDMHSITSKLQNYLEFISNLGLKGADCSEQALEMIKSWGHPPLPVNESLADIENELTKCRKCRLADHGHPGVMGAGRPGVRVMFVGGWPEPEDESSGKPYSGKAGELLGRIIQAMGLSRENVYITHVLKCRPPKNYQPKTGEIKTCCGFARREIHVVKPNVIFALGEAAADALLEEESAWEKLRGRFHYYHDIPVMPTFSPEHLLADPSAKRETWDNIKQVLKRIKEP